MPNECRMRVSKYIPERLYGFCQDDTGFEVFFHLASFQPGPDIVLVKCSRCPGSPRCHIGTQAPPPILGEFVLVTFDAVEGQQRAPRASKVVREAHPQRILGTVETFDTDRRYGFVKGMDQVAYHLHQSEVLDGRLPLAGKKVVFFPGVRENRPRACHVKVCK